MEVNNTIVINTRLISFEIIFFKFFYLFFKNFFIYFLKIFNNLDFKFYLKIKINIYIDYIINKNNFHYERLL